MATFDRKEDYLYIRWAKEVKQRDGHSCHICGQTGGDLNSHHLNGWNAYPDQRYDLENGVTLCSGCHDRFHDIYGRGDNTEDQFHEFEKLCEVIIKASEKKNRVEFVRDRIKSKMKDGYG